MHKKAFVLMMLVALSAGILSCGICSRRIDCPGFRETALSTWLPYQNADRLVFTGGGSSQTFTLRDLYTTEPYTSRTSTSGGQNCYATKSFISEEANPTTTQPHFRAELEIMSLENDDDPQLLNASIQMNGQYINLRNLADTGFANVQVNFRPAVTQLLSAVSFNGRNYGPVQMAILDTTKIKEPGIFQVYMAPGHGLIAWREYPSLTLWAKQ